MRTIKALKLNQLSKSELEARQMGMLWGGGGSTCGCSCTGSTLTASEHNAYIYMNGGSDDDLCACSCMGTSSTSSNNTSNSYNGYGSSGGSYEGNSGCACVCGATQDSYGVFNLSNR